MLSTSLQADNLKVRGVVTHELGDTIEFVGKDDTKTPYKLSVSSKPNGDKTAMFIYKLERNGRTESGSILQMVGQNATLAMGESGKEPSLKFDVIYNQ